MPFAEHNQADHIRSEMERRAAQNLVLKGNTFQKKEAIKEEGGIWDAANKSWLMPSEEAAASLGARKAEDGSHWII